MIRFWLVMDFIFHNVIAGAVAGHFIYAVPEVAWTVDSYVEFHEVRVVETVCTFVQLRDDVSAVIHVAVLAYFRRAPCPAAFFYIVQSAAFGFWSFYGRVRFIAS